MIKYYCDRCGREMENANGEKENVVVQFDYNRRREVFDGERKLFCKKCKKELKAWLKGEGNGIQT